MPRLEKNTILFGTAEDLPPIRSVSLGHFSFLVERNGLRNLIWKSVEVLRGVSTVLRDENWGIIPDDTFHQEIEEGPDFFRLIQRATFLGGQLTGETQFSLYSEGRAEFTFKLSAKADVKVNRAGFTILHPVNGVAGSSARVRHSDGSQEDVTFPKRIAPAQPIIDIVGLSHQIGNTQVSLDFDGEVFEMEDQRNWSDVSFKTYCRPLSLPFPYQINTGETVQQSIRLGLSNSGGTDADKAQSAEVANKNPLQSPDILLAVEGGWREDANASANGFVLRIDREHVSDPKFLHALAVRAKGENTYIDVELVLNDGDDVAAQFGRIAAMLENAEISPRHVIALPQAYLKSYQPTGPWPDGLTPEECAATARRFFPDAHIGTGSLTNFTELNRYRSKAGTGDYITHGNAAIVHAADNRSVIETLEALPQIFESGRLIAGERDYRLGLVGIAMRGNPYGAALAENPENIRKTMTGNDPRQKGLFAAAYAIGVAANVAAADIGAVTLAGVGGPFRVCEGEALFPIFHTIKALSIIAGRDVQVISNKPEGVFGLRFDGGLIIANCTADPVEVSPPLANAAILDEAQFSAASQDPDWLVNATGPSNGPVTLGAFGCLFSGLEVSE